MKALFALIGIIAIFFHLSPDAKAAQGTAQARMTVKAGVLITPVSDLIFSEAAAGSPSETIPADAVETISNASFNITGLANSAVYVTLPADGVIKMKTSGGGTADSEIAVDHFTSNSLTQLDATGNAVLFVGATRASLLPDQSVGSYEGAFVVDVVY